MLTTLHNRLASLATWPIVSILLVAFIMCQQGFGWRQKALHYIEPPDVKIWYDSTELNAIFRCWTTTGRTLYGWTEVTLDLVFLLTYGLLFAILLAQLFRTGAWRGLILVPLVGALADLGENTLLTFLAWSTQDPDSRLVFAAACFTAVKIVLFTITLLLLLAGGFVNWRSGPAVQGPRP